MRANKDSLLAILEAFAYDPLISFRLLNPKILKQNQKKKDEEQAKANEEKLQQIKTGV
jgi:phosphatidylinositol kinase/protein kinase (PI-3  family)